jgi:predicted nucleic acid-binding Zn ribbon protein
MLARTPVMVLRIAAPKPVKRLQRYRFVAIRDLVAAIMREAEPTPFAVEGPCIIGLRSRLCLDGWRWQDADAVAAAIVRAALNLVGAKRPTWAQGQPGWTEDGVVPETRERCVRCAKPLPEENSKYCGPVCAMAAKIDRNRRRDKEAAYAAGKVYRAAWSKRQPERTCPVCGKAFQPKSLGSIFCSRACYFDTRRLPGRKVPAVCEPL